MTHKQKKRKHFIKYHRQKQVTQLYFFHTKLFNQKNRQKDSNSSNDGLILLHLHDVLQIHEDGIFPYVIELSNDGSKNKTIARNKKSM